MRSKSENLKIQLKYIEIGNDIGRCTLNTFLINKLYK